MNFIVFSLTLLFASFIARWIFAGGLLACGVPRLLFQRNGEPNKVMAGIALALLVLFQLYFWGLWAAFCVAVTYKFTHKPEVTWDWMYFAAGFLESSAIITWFGLKQQRMEVGEERVKTQRAEMFFGVITWICFVVFAVWPHLVMPPYGWAMNLSGLSKHLTVASEQVSTEGNEPPEGAVDGTAMRRELLQCFDLAREADNIGQPPDESGRAYTVPADRQRDMIDKMKRSIAIGRNVDGRLLDWLAPDMERHFRDEFLQGMELYVKGIETDSVGPQLEANRCRESWSRWWEANRETVLKRAFPE